MEEFKKIQTYSLDKWWFGLYKSVITGILDLSLIIFNVLPSVWNISMRAVLAWGFSSAIEIQASVVFCLLLQFLQTIMEVPWSIYSTFVIEERHGFNKQTFNTFATDFIKQMALSVALIPPLVALFTLLLQRAGRWLVPSAVGFMLALQLVAMLIYPKIAALFNKFEPLPSNDLRTEIENLAESLKFPLTKLYVVDGSTRSAHSNAYFFGLSFLKNMRIVLFDTLIEQCTTKQIVAVLAHELGHWKLKHTYKNLMLGQLTILMQFALFEAMNSPALLQSFGFVEQPVLLSFVVFSFVISPIDEVIGFLTNILSRKYEFEADEFAAKLGHGEALKEGLLVLDSKNKSAQNMDALYAAYHSSHPRLSERLAAVDEVLKKGQ